VVTSTHLSALLFSHLLRNSPNAKSLALSITPPSLASSPSTAPGATSFFVPADDAPPPDPIPQGGEDDEPPQTLLQILTENLSLSLLSRSRSDTSERESREWDRLVVGYLCLLNQWLWDDAAAVKVFLDAGGLGVVRDLFLILWLMLELMIYSACRACKPDS
jgi:intracellular protein transport protein USO1